MSDTVCAPGLYKRIRIVQCNEQFKAAALSPTVNCIYQPDPMQHDARSVADELYVDFREKKRQMDNQSSIWRYVRNLATYKDSMGQAARKIMSNHDLLESMGLVQQLRIVGPGYHDGVAHKAHIDLGEIMDDKGRVVIDYIDGINFSSNENCILADRILEPGASKPTATFNLKTQDQFGKTNPGDKIRFLGEDNLFDTEGFIHWVDEVRSYEGLRLVHIAEPPSWKGFNPD